MRIAAWQCTPLPLDVAANLARLERACGQAAAAGAQVLVTPEMFTTGYAVGAGAVRELAEPSDGPTALAVQAIAASCGLTVVYGYPELADRTTYNAANVMGPGGLVATHRKVHLWGVDHDQFAPSSHAPAPFTLEGAAAPTRAGALICFDVEFPEAVRHLAIAGARMVLVPTANPAGFEQVQQVLLRARAWESGVALVYANYVGTDGVLTYGGLSTIVGADGTVHAVAPAEEETLLLADVTLASEVRKDYLAGLRPELYRET